MLTDDILSKEKVLSNSDTISAHLKQCCSSVDEANAEAAGEMVVNNFLLKIFLASKSDGLVIPDKKVKLLKDIFACLIGLKIGKAATSPIEESVVKNFLEFVLASGFKTEFVLEDASVKFICRHQGESESISNVIKESVSKINTPSQINLVSRLTGKVNSEVHQAVSAHALKQLLQ